MSQENGTGVDCTVPETAKRTICPNCGQMVFAVRMTSDEVGEVLVQPVVIRGVIADRVLVATPGRTEPEELIRKVIARTATGALSPPVLVPHNLVCIQAVLNRTLPVPYRIAAMAPEPRPPDDPRTPPPGHKPVTHDLEIQSGKIGTASKFKKGEGDNDPN